MRRVVLTFAASGLVAALAHGEPNDHVRQAADAFEQGRFQDAARLAEASGQADAFALAARSVLAEVICGDTELDPLALERAVLLANAALAGDPAHVEGRLQLAIALSLKARGMSRTQAWRTGLGEQARDLAEAVLVDDPNNAYAHGFLAVWHVEVVRRGGGLGASMMDASLAEGFAHYEAAANLVPEDPGLHWQMARALAAHNPRRHRDRIETAIAAALASDGETPLDAVMMRRAAVLAEALRSLNANEVKRLAREML
ncbi:MAG: hypothetical protein AAFX86_05000 [Pseudomonadota bacterium]